MRVMGNCWRGASGARSAAYPRQIGGSPVRLLLLLVLCLHPSLSFAQGSDAALAEELFRQGKALMKLEDFSSACMKFQESQRLDPATGTLINLANCHEKTGKLASAWSEYAEVVTIATRQQRKDRIKYAEARLLEIEPRLSRLVLTLAPDHNLPGLKVVLNGTEVGRAAWKVPLPVDPGESIIEVSAPKRIKIATRVVIEAGPSQQEFKIPLLKKTPHPESSTTAVDEGEEVARKNRRRAGIVGGSVGVLGIGAGALFGILALNKDSLSYENGCDETDCNEEGQDLRNDAIRFGNASTALFIAGGVFLAGGIVLYLSSRDPAEAVHASEPSFKIQMAPGGGSVAFRTVF